VAVMTLQAACRMSAAELETIMAGRIAARAEKI
jgi:hypothetical protein